MKQLQDKTHVKLIFNSSSGANNESPVQLTSIIHELQALAFVPETYLINPGCDLSGTIKEAITQGIEMFVVCGGDGTVSSVARELYGKNVTLGIIPTGTQNNVAFSLGIPFDIPSAARLLRTGSRMKVDVGMVSCGNNEMPFIEVCSVGLLSTVFSSADEIQHGNLLKINDFLTKFIATKPGEIHLLLDDEKEIQGTGHLVLISNMPYIIRHFEVGSVDSLHDGLLDILLLADMSKLDLVGYAIDGEKLNKSEDSRIQRYRVRKVQILSTPLMPVMADGLDLGKGQVCVEVRHAALTMIAPHHAPETAHKQGENFERKTKSRQDKPHI